MKIDAGLIQAMARDGYGMAMDTARAEEIAVEVDALTHAVRQAERSLSFDDDPSEFALALLALRSTRRGAKS